MEIKYKIKDIFKKANIEPFIYPKDNKQVRKLEKFLNLPIYYDKENDRYYLNDRNMYYFYSIKRVSFVDNHYRPVLEVESLPNFKKGFCKYAIGKAYGNYKRYKREQEESGNWPLEWIEFGSEFILSVISNKYLVIKEISTDWIQFWDTSNYEGDIYFHLYIIDLDNLRITKLTRREVEEIDAIEYIYKNYFFYYGKEIIELDARPSNGPYIKKADYDEFFKELDLSNIIFLNNFWRLFGVLSHLEEENKLKEEYLEKLLNKDISKYIFNPENLESFKAYSSGDMIFRYLNKNFGKIFDKENFEYTKKNIEALYKYFKDNIVYWFDYKIKDIDEELFNKLYNEYIKQFSKLRKTKKFKRIV